MSERKKILDKVRKLVERANGTDFEGEAKTCMNMARDLLARNQLSMAEALDAPARTQKLEREELDENVMFGRWQVRLAQLVSEFTACETFCDRAGGRRRRLVFIGAPTELAVCKLLWDALYPQVYKRIDEEKARYRKSYAEHYNCKPELWRSRRNTGNYIAGLMSGLEQALAERQAAEADCKALVLVKPDALAKLVAAVPRTPSPRCHANAGSATFHRGYQHGKSTGINPALSEENRG